MAGEFEGWIEAHRKVNEYQAQLSRTADPAERRAIRTRIEVAEAKRAELMVALRAAAAEGDTEAVELFRQFGEPVPKG